MRRGPHVSGWACPVSTLTGWTQSTGPTGPLAVALGGGQAGPVGGRRRRNSGDQNRGGPSPELAGIVLRGSGRNGARPIRKNSQRRIQGWPGLRRTRPESAPASGGGGGAQGARRKRGYGGLSSKRRGWGASTRGGECNGLEPVTKRSPEPCRRRAPRRCVRTLIGDGARRHGRECARACSAPRNPRSTTVSLGERVNVHNNGNYLVGGDVFRRKQSGGYGSSRGQGSEGRG